MASNSTASGGGIGMTGALFLIFLTLKLTGTIDWSWWWVCAPLWIPLAIVLVILAVVGIAAGVGGAYRIIAHRNWRKKRFGF